jgi:hypothetical protein
MSGLYLELGALNPTLKTTGQSVPNLMDLMQPEGFVPDLNLAESVSTASSPLSPATEKTLPAGQSAIVNSDEILSGLSDTLSTLSERLPKPNSTVNNSTLNTVNNSLSITSDLVKIEPKKVELSIKDVAALEDLIKNISSAKEESTKTTPDVVSTKALTTVPEETVSNKPKVSLDLFRTALSQQENQLEADVNSIIASGGDLSTIFKTDVVSATGSAAGGELSNTFSKGITSAVEEFERTAEIEKTKREAQTTATLSSNDPAAILSLISNPLAPAKEVEPPTFNKAIAQGLTDVAESNSKIVSQTNIVNQAASTSPVQPQPKPIEEVTPNQPQPNQAATADEMQPNTVSVNSGDPALAGYMLQMLNILKSGQLKVKIS